MGVLYTGSSNFYTKLELEERGNLRDFLGAIAGFMYLEGKLAFSGYWGRKSRSAYGLEGGRA
jgi:hypothetical protein